jgi:hypothetical protein
LCLLVIGDGAYGGNGDGGNGAHGERLNAEELRSRSSGEILYKRSNSTKMYMGFSVAHSASAPPR